MFRRGLLLFWLLVSSLVATTTVHAREASFAPAMDCTGFVHQDGDADQSSGDADSNVSHHHGGCHGHHVSTVADSASDTMARKRDLPLPRAVAGLAREAANPVLRPPIA